MAKTRFFIGLALWFGLAFTAATAMALASAYLYLSPKLPSVETLRDFRHQTPLRIYSSDGLQIGQFGEKIRTPLRFEQLDPNFVNALLAAEDDRFFSHGGVNIKGILRAVSQLLITGEKGSGGSTITMQVAREVFLSRERIFIRKFNEIILAVEMERALSKEEIFEIYINEIFLGHRAYGYEAAAQVYYGKPLHELTIAQWAMLAGLPKAPSAFNPIVNPKRALIRRDWIINRMLRLGYIDQPSYEVAINSPITAEKHGATLDQDAPYVAELARQELYRMYGRGIYSDGYVAYTTVRADMQKSADEAVRKGLLAYDSRHGFRGPEMHLEPNEDGDIQHWLDTLANTDSIGGLEPAFVTAVEEQAAAIVLANGEVGRIEWKAGLSDARRFISINRRSFKPKTASDVVAVGDLIRVQKHEDGSWELSQIPAAQAALVSLDPSTGAIRAITGGFDFKQSKFNRVTQAARQPGSNLKPFIYAGAIEHGFTAATIINDAPVVFNDSLLESTWRPENSSGKFAGPTRLREALYNSRNLVSIRLLRDFGIDRAIDYLTRFGFEREKLPQDLSLALGTLAVPPITVANAYTSIANGGYLVSPYVVERVENLRGEEVYRANPASVPAADELVEPVDEPMLDDEAALAALEAELGFEAPEITSGEPVSHETAPIEAERVMDARVAYIVNSILKDTIKKGTGRRALSMRRSDIAGKTGTTNGPTDAWFSGYTPDLVTTTWLGFDDNSKIGANEYGSKAALPIWIDFMKYALKGKEQSELPQPEGIVTVLIDPKTGKRAQPGQSNAVFEIFREELAPTLLASNTGNQNTDEDYLPEELF